MNQTSGSIDVPVVLASPSAAVIAYWSSVLSDYPQCLVNDRVTLEGLAGAEASVRPCMILCDEKLILNGRDPLLTELSRMGDGVPILIMVADDPEDIDIEWLHCGVRGCCSLMLEEAMLHKAVVTLIAGETWLPRRLIAKIITTFVDDIKTNETETIKQGDYLATLTSRECEVAKLVTQGLNNKLIARQLDVSERTVKAHLGNIFQKLDIDNRLMLALTLKNYF